jgi:outer membrane protein assembly factor BamB
MGMNGSVAALDRQTGRIVWHWQSPKARYSFVSIFLDGDRILAGLSGYLYCLDSATGRVLWENGLKGFGYGNFSFASLRGQMPIYAAAQQEDEDEAARRSSSSSSE